ncbi:MAG: sulfotransferase [Gammaproteobacteria bacterium]
MTPAESTEALAARGLSLLAQQQDADALPVFEELTQAQPRHIAHWVNLGTILRRLQRYDEALLAYAQAGALGERSANFYFNVGLLHQDRGDYDTARRVLADAMRAAPLDAEIRCQYAQCCYESLRIEEATAALADWAQWPDLNSEQLATIALLLLNLGESASSDQAAARAAADPAPPPATLLRLAQIQERSNRLKAAKTSLERLQALPDAASALGPDLQLLEAQIALREARHEEALHLFTDLAAVCTEAHRRHLYLFPLAKTLDALKRHDEAYACLQSAHEAQMLHLARSNPDAAGIKEPPLLITRHGCDPDDVAAWGLPIDQAGKAANHPSAAGSPVFIVAFPRSGTTLLEQMLDAHPQLVTMDEQPFLQQAIDRIMDLGIDYPGGMAKLTAEQLADVRDHYWSLTRRKVQLEPGQRLIDKNPLNLLRLPAIRRLFPQARILLAIRHPCDVILSCFMQHFRAPEFAVLCKDLPTLARGYRRSFDFWYQQAELLQPMVREVPYEDFVADFEACSRDITAFLELPWNQAQSQPGEHARARGFISTPSYAQVIEPVNRRAVGRWKPYARHFDEALEIVQSCIDRWDY